MNFELCRHNRYHLLSYSQFLTKPALRSRQIRWRSPFLRKCGRRVLCFGNAYVLGIFLMTAQITRSSLERFNNFFSFMLRHKNKTFSISVVIIEKHYQFIPNFLAYSNIRTCRYEPGQSPRDHYYLFGFPGWFSWSFQC